MKKCTWKRIAAVFIGATAAMQSVGFCGMVSAAEEGTDAVMESEVITTTTTSMVTTTIPAVETEPLVTTTAKPMTTMPIYTTTADPMWTTTADSNGTTTGIEDTKQYFSMKVRLLETENYTILPGVKLRLVKYNEFVDYGYHPSVTGEVLMEWDSAEGDPCYLIEDIEFTYGSYYRVEGELPEGYVLEGEPFTYSRTIGGYSVPQNDEMTLFAEKLPDCFMGVEFPLEGVFRMKFNFIDDVTDDYFEGLGVTIYQVLNNQTEMKEVASWTTDSEQSVVELPYYLKNSADSCYYNYVVSGLPEGYSHYGNDVSTPHYSINFLFDSENLRQELESGAMYESELTCRLHKDYKKPVSNTGTMTMTTTLPITTTITTIDLAEDTTTAPEVTTTTETVETTGIPTDTTTTTTMTSALEDVSTTTTTLPQTGYDKRYQLLMIAAGCITVLGIAVMTGILLDKRSIKS